MTPAEKAAELLEEALQDLADGASYQAIKNINAALSCLTESGAGFPNDKSLVEKE